MACAGDDKIEKKTEGVEAQPRKRQLCSEFDIDDYELPEPQPKVFVNEDCLGSKSHKHAHCAGKAEECNDMCEMMKKIDQLSALRKVKKLKLSLKYRKGSKK